MTGYECEGCDGSGVRAPASPSCEIEMPSGWIVVERCDACEQYPDDLEAALSLFREATWVDCRSGSGHVIANPQSSRSPRGQQWLFR